MTGFKGEPTPRTPIGGIARHGAAIYDEAPHDPYQAKGKYSEPARCNECGAAYHRGRWQWGEAPHGARDVLCPACHRIHDKLPAGTLTLEGTFVDAHRDELLGVARNEGAHEKGDHPLHRIMGIEEAPGKITVTTTDIHLPQRIGTALKHAYQGELEVEYAKEECSVRARWRR
jgi:hypothetical protein